MKKKKLINWLCLSGILSAIFYLLHDIIGAMYYPNYNWLSQAVSDLTATDAPSFVIASGFATIYKIFNCLCCALLCILIKNENKKTLRLGVYLFFIMNFISAIGALKEKHKVLGVLAILSLVLMFIGAVGSGIVPREYFGVIERFSTYSAVIFTGILGIYGFKNETNYC